jgi:MoaA/NifB/PqqE/SkfB family radical SAM enzyme
MKREQGFMAWRTFKKAVNEMRGHAKTSYLHQIGEPLIHPKLTDFIDYANTADIWTSISTNGMLMTEEWVEKILKTELNEIVFCVDSMDAYTHERLRVGADFDLIMLNILRFIHLHAKSNNEMDVVIQMIEMKENLHERENFIKFWKEFKNVKPVIKIFSTFAGRIPKEGVPNRRFKCSKPNTSITIQWNGDVTPCCRDYDGIQIMGNVKNKSIKEIWDGPDYVAFRDLYRVSRLCERC